MIGEGPYESALRAAAGASALPVEFTGWLESSAVIEHLRHRADLLLLPARVSDDGDRDGIPNVILEAMTYYLPVVASAVGGIPEVVTPATGWSFPEGQLESAVAEIQSLVSDPEDRRERTLAARQLVAQKFDSEITADLRISLFQAALSKSSS